MYLKFRMDLIEASYASPIDQFVLGFLQPSGQERTGPRLAHLHPKALSIAGGSQVTGKTRGRGRHKEMAYWVGRQKSSRSHKILVM